MTLNIAIVGCDTSHSVHFTRLLNDPAAPDHVPGARVVAAVTDGFGSIEGSRGRALANAEELQTQLQIPLYESIQDLPSDLDAIFLENTDGDRHLEQFLEILPFKVPVFIDKPLALNSLDAERIFELAQDNGIPVMSSSALRYDDSFRAALSASQDSEILGLDIYGPMTFVNGCPEYFWYGIHTAEMLFAALGEGLEEVQVLQAPDSDVLSGRWQNGQIGTIRGTRKPHFSFGGTFHTVAGPKPFVVEGGVPFYARLLAQVVDFVRTGDSPIDYRETLDIIRFLETAQGKRALELTAV